MTRCRSFHGDSETITVDLNRMNGPLRESRRFLINLAAGLTRLPLRTFFFATMLGIIPGGFVYVNAGASLATIDSLSGIASPRVFGSFALLGLFALVPVVYNRFKRKKGAEN